MSWVLIVCEDCQGKGWQYDGPTSGGSRHTKDACYECGGSGDLEVWTENDSEAMA